MLNWEEKRATSVYGFLFFLSLKIRLGWSQQEDEPYNLGQPSIYHLSYGFDEQIHRRLLGYGGQVNTMVMVQAHS